MSDLQEALVAHISSEIKECSSSALTWRTRSAFTVWISPFLLAGAVVVRGKAVPVSEVASHTTLLALIFVFYILLGIGLALIERRYWSRANELRASLVDLCVAPGDVRKAVAASLHDRITRKNLISGYVFSFVVLYLVFLFLLALLTSLAS